MIKICQPAIIFFLTMILYVLSVSQSNNTLVVRLTTVGIISYCIQYLCDNNFTFIAWLLTFIPFIYIISIYIMLILINKY